MTFFSVRKPCLSAIGSAMRPIALCLLAGGCLFACLVSQGCSHHGALVNGIPTSCYQAEAGAGNAMERFAPVFLARGTDKEHNRIGRPVAYPAENGKPVVHVSSEKPVYYVRKTDFSTSRGQYCNLVYRVHFSKIPYSLLPFTLTAGKNAGLMVVVTLNDQGQPVLVTTVHTCGCYCSIIPTTYLPKECLPGSWEDRPKKVYGERHPALLDFSSEKGQRLLIELRPDIHRVMDVRLIRASAVNLINESLIEAPLIPAQSLENLEVEGMEPVSFFHESGFKTGFVKGAVKPWETLFMSWMALDIFIGSDKAYSPMADNANPFYTSLKPWNRQKSNMWRFRDFLKFWGYDL